MVTHAHSGWFGVEHSAVAAARARNIQVGCAGGVALP